MKVSPRDSDSKRSGPGLPLMQHELPTPARALADPWFGRATQCLATRDAAPDSLSSLSVRLKEAVTVNLTHIVGAFVAGFVLPLCLRVLEAMNWFSPAARQMTALSDMLRGRTSRPFNGRATMSTEKSRHANHGNLPKRPGRIDLCRLALRIRAHNRM